MLAAAAAVGALAGVNPFYAVALVLAAGLVLLVASNVSALPVFLTLTMFMESVALGPGLRIGRVAAGMALIVIAYEVLGRGARGLRRNGLLTVAGAYGLWILSSLFWAQDGGAVAGIFLKYVLAFAYMVTFAVLVRTRRQFTAVFVTFALGALVFGVLSFIGYANSGTQYAAEGTGATGLQGDHNYFAVYQVIALPAALTVAALSRSRARRMLFLGVVGVIVLSVVASLSRSGLLALVGVVLATLVLPYRFFFRRRREKFTYVLAIVVALFVTSAIGSTPFVQRAQSIYKESGSGISGHRGSGRIDLWRAAMHGYRAHPLLGLGAGNFSSQSIQLVQDTPGTDPSAAYAQEHLVVHNIYIESLAELGPLGLALFLGLLFAVGRTLLAAFRRGRRARDRQIELYSVALLVALLAYCVAGLFLSIELSKPLWILIGLALALDVVTRRPVVEVVPVSLPARPATERPQRIYDPPMDERQLEERGRKIAERTKALLVEEERLQRLRELLSVRQRQLEVRELGGGGGGITARRLEVLSEREKELAKRAAEVAVRERALAQLERQLHARASVVAPVLEPAPAPEPAPPPESEAAPPPQPAPAPEPEPYPATAPDLVDPAEWTLFDLEKLVRESGEEFAGQADEWAFTLYYLREHSDAEGRLPPSFDVLIGEVFGPLLDR